MSKHGMQMGSSGYGMSHGAAGSSAYDRGDTGGSQGDKDAGYEHGVSLSWVRSKTLSGHKKASPERVKQFRKRMGRQLDASMDKRGIAGADTPQHKMDFALRTAKLKRKR